VAETNINHTNSNSYRLPRTQGALARTDSTTKRNRKKRKRRKRNSVFLETHAATGPDAVKQCALITAEDQTSNTIEMRGRTLLLDCEYPPPGG
jgi:hypothetical protein